MDKKKKEEIDRQIRLIHNLATRLPWIAVIGALIIMIITIIQALLIKYFH